jgi:hypothetical protein
VPGAFFGGLLILLLFAQTQSYADRNDRASGAAALSAGITIAFISYGAWQSWWVAALMLAEASMLLGCNPASGNEQ